MDRKSGNKKNVVTREETLREANVAKFSAHQPDDLIYDPKYDMAVSRQGKDRGAIVREGDTDVIFDPDGNGKVEVARVYSVLLRMLRDGMITEDMARAGAYFMAHFSIAGYQHYVSIDLASPGKGSTGGIEEHMTRTLHSRDIVRDFIEYVGYPYTAMSKALFWMLGHGVGLEKMAKNKDLHGMNGASDARYWRAVLVSALEMISLKFKEGDRSCKGDRIKGRRNFSQDDLIIRER